MARIPDHEIERLKAEVSIQRLAESAGIELKRHGKDYLGHCPFHDDKTPSLVITPAKNLWHCLGACQTGGSVIDWIMKREGISFRHAVELLNRESPVLAADPPKRVASKAQKLDTPFAADAGDADLMHTVIDFYHETLQQSPEALAYLDKRGLNHPELIDHFQLGFANRTLAYRLPPKQVKAGNEMRSALQRIGILRDSGHEHFNGSIVVPIFDADRNIVEAYARKITANLRKGTPLHLYLPGPHAGVWNRAGLNGQKEIILCEALIDAMTFWCAGYRNVTAAYGIEGFTAEHLEAIKTSGVERVLMAYDRDDAGNAAAEKLASRLTAEGLDVFRLHFPKGMDANDYAMQVTPASKSLGVVIRSAEWLGYGTKPTIETAAPIPETPTPPAPRAEPNPCLAAKGENANASGATEPTPEPETPPLPAAAVPEPPNPDIDAQINDQEVIVAFGPRRYRVRGLAKNNSYEVLKVNILVAVDEAIHVDTFDLYSAKHRAAFTKQAAAELLIEAQIIQRDLGRLLLKLEALQDEHIQAALQPKLPEAVQISEDERADALAFLKAPDLIGRITTDFERVGLVGEPTNALIGYLSAVSRKLARPLAIIVQSTSAAGKSALMDAVIDLIPAEDRVHYSAMTGQSLFYLGETDLKHKILAIAEEEGVRQAAYALKLLQSQGELTIASTGKDPESGKLVTEEYRVEGPVMLFLTTTAIDLDEELLNRCLVLTIDESREQTRAIQQRQRAGRTLQGLLAENQADSITQVHQNAQRLLRPLAVVNPFAEQLTFLDERTRTRRDHQKYLTLIDTIALLHQHQREIKRIAHAGKTLEYIEVTKADIALANRLAHDVLGRSLDELPPQTRRLLGELDSMARAACECDGLLRADYRFTRRTLREHTGWGDTQLKVHLARLVELEYLHVHRQGQTYTYALAYAGEGTDGQRFMVGLIDPDHLYDGQRSGQTADRSALGRGAVGGVSAPGRTDKNGYKANPDKALAVSEPDKAKTALNGREKTQPSHRNPNAPAPSSLAASV